VLLGGGSIELINRDENKVWCSAETRGAQWRHRALHRCFLIGNPCTKLVPALIPYYIFPQDRGYYKVMTFSFDPCP